MKLTNLFIQIIFLLLCGVDFSEARSPLDSFEQAKLHSIVADKPAIDFFEGALLGNGGMGVVVSTRPDGVVLYFGHNNVSATLKTGKVEEIQVSSEVGGVLRIMVMLVMAVLPTSPSGLGGESSEQAKDKAGEQRGHGTTRF